MTDAQSLSESEQGRGAGGTDIELGFDPCRPPRFWTALREDVRAHVGGSLESLTGRRLLAVSARVLFGSPGFRMTVLHRASFSLRAAFGPPGRVLAGMLFWLIRHAYGCSIASTARLQGGVIFPHPQGIVIGPDVRLGPRGWIFQNVTIGGAPGREGLPTIGADARIYPGAVLAGPIRIGRNVVVGANAVVVRDVPPQSLVRPSGIEIQPVPAHMRVDDDSALSP